MEYLLVRQYVKYWVHHAVATATWLEDDNGWDLSFVVFGGITPLIFFTTLIFCLGLSCGASDDRLKHKEEDITDALNTLCKLRPQKYLKYDPKNGVPNKDDEKWESGLIAQEIYYDAPELRHVINIPKGADPQPLDKAYDIQDDPDYEKLGWTDESPPTIGS